MEEIVLHRAKITGILDENTPFCVVKEILQAHNLSSVKIDEKDIKFSILQNEVQKINSYRPTVLMGKLEDNLRYIATFVNPECRTWTKNSLIKSFHHLNHFLDDEIDISTIQYSQKDPNNIEAYNACMLYGLCKKYQIETHWKMTGIQMLQLIQKYTLDIHQLRSGLIPLIDILTKSQLLSIYSILNRKTTDSSSFQPLIQGSRTTRTDVLTVKKDIPPLLTLDPIKLVEVHKQFIDMTFLLSSIEPKTHFEAIVLFALLYQLNITESKYPLLEYDEFQKYKNKDLYIPYDSQFQKKYRKNKEWYSIHHHWCPELAFVYSEKETKQFCIQEGYTSDDFRTFDANTLLHMSRISINIYSGKNVCNLEEKSTPIYLESVSEITNDECFTLGLLSEPESLQTYHSSELADTFIQLKNYIHPKYNNEALPNRVISKLQLLSMKKGNQDLLKAITVVEKWKQYSNEFSENLRKYYSQNPTVVDYLYKVLDCAMYMRGWKVNMETYPLTEEQTKFISEENQNKLETNVFESIQALQKWIEETSQYSEEEKVCLKKLPLMKFSQEGETKVFVLTPDPDDGDSILHRLEIVLSGDKYKNMKSCIRLSSNILLHSVYFYICSLGLPEPYNIFELSHIT